MIDVSSSCPVHSSLRGMMLRDPPGHRHLGIPVEFQDEPAQPLPTLLALGEHAVALLGEIACLSRG